MVINLSVKGKNYLLIMLILGLAGETIWVNLQNMKLKQSRALETPTVSEGAAAPSFELPATDGQLFKLADTRGFPLTIVYLAPDCRTCDRDTMFWHTLYEYRSSSEGVFIGISSSDSASTLLYKGMHGLDFPVLLDRDRHVAGSYGITAAPEIIRIDEKGRITGRFALW